MSEKLYYININSMHVKSINTFANINGRFRNNNKDVYFICKFGYEDEREYKKSIEYMDDILTKNTVLYNSGYVRINKLIGAVKNEDVKRYASFYDELSLRGKNKLVKAYFNFEDSIAENTLIAAFNKIIDLFCAISNNVSESMKKKFGIKLMCWFDAYAKELFLNKRELIKTPKFVYVGELKQQEFLFLYFLVLAGCDVMWLNPDGDCGIKKGLLDLASVSYEKNIKKIDIPEYCVKSKKYNKERNFNNIKNNCEDNNNLKIKHDEDKKQVELNRIIQIARSNEEYKGSLERPKIVIPPKSDIVRNVPIKGKENRPLEYEELAKLAASVVMIAVYDKKGECYKAGSGVMIDERGYILTNFHVASNASKYSIRIEEEEKIYETDELVKYNDMLDLAVIRIDRRCRAIPIYKGAKELVRGQKVVAIGSPLGLFNTVSDGIISGFRKNTENQSLVQFTAPISSGSSGGALLDLYGNLIGINSCGYDAGENLNFAIDYKTVLAFVSGFVTT